jgi:CBS domain-containing protein
LRSLAVIQGDLWRFASSAGLTTHGFDSTISQACGVFPAQEEFMKLHEILSAKGNRVCSISPDASLQDVVERLLEHRIGSLVVLELDGRGNQVLVGIVTEHDILRACSPGSRSLREIRVFEMMSKPLITAAPDDEVEQVMGLMTTRRIRHLPVLQEGVLAGIISIGDVVKAQHDQLALENKFMKDYIGTPR